MDLELPNVSGASAISGVRHETQEHPTVLTRPLLIALSVACAMAIANLYYNQLLLPQIGRTFGVTEREVGGLPMLAQAVFALGIFLLAPLEDTLERGRLNLIMLGLLTVSLARAALSPNIVCLSVASFA